MVKEGLTLRLSVFTAIATTAGQVDGEVTEYTVLTRGLAITFAPVAELRPNSGDQVNTPAPLAVKAVEDPKHIILLPLMFNTGFTVIAMVLVLEQLKKVAATV